MTKKIRLIELFAGIGAQAKALENLGVNFEHYKVVEFDKFAIDSYNAIHGTNFGTSDITKVKGKDLEIVDTNTYNYIMTYSFPCQDLSLAGNQKGMEKGSGTRSGLLWEVERLLNETKELPQILLMENVTQVHGKKNLADFESWIQFLESKGYKNYWKDLNAKDFGIPQNRNRCFMVSLLEEKEYAFPSPIALKKKLNDFLLPKVEEKYFLSQKAIDGRLNTSYNQYRLDTRLVNDMDIHPTILARFDGAPTLVKVKESSTTNNHLNKGKVGYGLSKNIIDDTQQVLIEAFELEPNYDLFVRKLTPLECWRLMGFDDDDLHRAEKVNSNSQLYKQAGNSIVVNVLEEIFKSLL